MFTVNREKRNSIEEKIETMLDHVLQDEANDEQVISSNGEDDQSSENDIAPVFIGRELNKHKTAKVELDPKCKLNEDMMSPSEAMQRRAKRFNTATPVQAEVPNAYQFSPFGNGYFNNEQRKRNSVLYFMNSTMPNYPQMAINQQQYTTPYAQFPQSNQNHVHFQMQNMLNYQQQIDMQNSYMNLHRPQIFNFQENFDQVTMQRSLNKKATYDMKNMMSLGNMTQNCPNYVYHSSLKSKSTIAPNDKNIKNELALYELEVTLTKSEKIDNVIFAKLEGHFVNIIKTQKGSRIFQNYLNNTSSDIIHLIFCEIQSELILLIADPYANYFCQKFFSFLSQKDRILFLNAIEGSLLSLSINKIGTYPIQGIIEQIGSKVEKELIVNGIKDNLFELATDTYGTHVMEKILSCFEEEIVGFIYDFALSNFLKLANHSNGLCIVKKLVAMTSKKDLHEKIRSLLSENALSLIQNPYGNYVLQVCIDTWTLDEAYPIISQFKNKFANLSMHKYSSNVVERCMEKSEVSLFQLISELTLTNRVADVMKNNYGNYVVQKALKLCNGTLKLQFIDEIAKNIPKLGEKKLIAKWKSILSSHIDQPDQIDNSLSVNMEKRVNISDAV